MKRTGRKKVTKRKTKQRRQKGKGLFGVGTFNANSAKSFMQAMEEPVKKLVTDLIFTITNIKNEHLFEFHKADNNFDKKAKV